MSHLLQISNLAGAIVSYRDMALARAATPCPLVRRKKEQRTTYPYMVKQVDWKLTGNRKKIPLRAHSLERIPLPLLSVSSVNRIGFAIVSSHAGFLIATVLWDWYYPQKINMHVQYLSYFLCIQNNYECFMSPICVMHCIGSAELNSVMIPLQYPVHCSYTSNKSFHFHQLHSVLQQSWWQPPFPHQWWIPLQLPVKQTQLVQCSMGHVDLSTFGRHINKMIPQKHKAAHLKFVHDLLPLGILNHQRAKVEDPALELCPCCRITDEDSSHFLRCTDNTKCEAGLTMLTKDSHPFGLTLATCIGYHLKGIGIIDKFPIEKHLHQHQDLIRQVLSEQHQIGWHHMLHGFLATSCHTLASIHPAKTNQSDRSRGHQRIQQAIQYTHGFTLWIWLGRNAALHQHQDTADAKIYTAETAELRYYHKNLLLLQ